VTDVSVATDDFNRADGALGSNWAYRTGTAAVSSNKARADTINLVEALYTGAGRLKSDSYAKFKIAAITVGNAPIIRALARFRSDAQQGYGFQWTGNTFQLHRWNNSSVAIGASFSSALAVNDVMEIRCVGNSITGYLNGVAICGGIDTTWLDGWYGGFASDVNVVGDVEIDDFECGNCEHSRGF